MKQIYLAATLFFIGATAFAQGNIKLMPLSGNVCNPMQITLDIKGSSFNPVTYLWSTGETTSTITIGTSGTYTLTVTGHHGNSPNWTTYTKTRTYNVLPVPQINALTSVWVCKGDTVRLQATAGYDTIIWNNGFVGSLFERQMNGVGTPGVPALDTANVSYTAIVTGVCSAESDGVVLRGIRKPNGVGSFYNGRMNLTSSDSIPAGLVLEYMTPVAYEMRFEEIGNANNIIKVTTAPGNRKVSASILEQGKSYTVTTSPVINNITYCPGAASTIGLASGLRLSHGFNENEEGLKTYRVYDVNGRLLLEKQAEQFDSKWLEGLTPQMFIVHKTGKTTEVSKIQVVR